MGRPRKFANNAEKAADYRARMKIEAERLRAIEDKVRLIISTARVMGLATETMTEVNVLDFVAGYLMEELTDKQVLEAVRKK